MADMTLDVVRGAVTGSAAAFRCRRRLQPGGGEGDKVFPPTFAGAVYAMEQRRVAGRKEPVQCVLLDSVQSQSNRKELALQEAVDAGKLKLPLLVVDFSRHDPTGDLDADRESGRLIDAVGKVRGDMPCANQRQNRGDGRTTAGVRHHRGISGRDFIARGRQYVRRSGGHSATLAGHVAD